MSMTFKKLFVWVTLGAVILMIGVFPLQAKRKKKSHPFDLFDHEMHNSFFEAVPVACETCHSDSESFVDHEKINKLGCHLCHNSPNPILPATNQCTICHTEGPPKPQSHKTDWFSKHQVYAKKNPAECQQCHTDQIFCINCHERRDTVQPKMHRRNFRFFHSIEARANPHRCDACHTVDTCQQCHAGRGNSLR